MSLGNPGILGQRGHTAVHPGIIPRWPSDPLLQWYMSRPVYIVLVFHASGLMLIFFTDCVLETYIIHVYYCLFYYAFPEQYSFSSSFFLSEK